MSEEDEWHNNDGTPPFGTVVEREGGLYVAVPAHAYGEGSCGGCAGRSGDSDRLCYRLPDCSGVKYIPKAVYDTDEFKVRLVEWRLEQ